MYAIVIENWEQAKKELSGKYSLSTYSENSHFVYVDNDKKEYPFAIEIEK